MAEEKGFLEKILGENIADKIDRGFVNLLGGGNLLGPSLSDYDDAVQQLEEMGMSAEDIIDMLGPRPETREERLNQKFKAERRTFKSKIQSRRWSCQHANGWRCKLRGHIGSYTTNLSNRFSTNYS